MRWILQITWICSIFLCGSAFAQQEKAAQPQGLVEEHHGSFSKTIPIDVPGYHGIEPNLSLSYNSSAGNGFAGVGWSLSGFSFIEHRGANKFASPFAGMGDTYLLDGNELLPCTVTSECSLPAGTNLTGYFHTKIESFQRIYFDSASNTWTVTGTNGVQLTFVAYFVTPSGTFRWLLRTVTNPRGQTTTYTWDCRPGAGSLTLDCYPQRVTYGKNDAFTVDVGRELLRPDPVVFGQGWEGGSLSGTYLGRTNDRLKTITVKVNGSVLRTYDLSYRSLRFSGEEFSEPSGRSVLETVTVHGKGGVESLPSTRFAYTGGAVSLAASVVTNVPGGPGCVNPEGVAQLPIMVGDFNGDGCTDFLWDDYSNPPGPKVWLARCDGSGQFVGPYKTSPTGWVSDPARWKFGDFNGDGMTDVMVIPYSISDTIPVTFQVYLAKGDGTFRGPYSGPSRTIHSLDDWPRKIDLASILVGDFDGDDADDVLTFECQGFPCANGTPKVYFSNPTVDPVQFYPPVNSVYITGPFHARVTYPETLADLSRVKLADINGDGATDVLMIQGVDTNEATAVPMTVSLAWLASPGQFLPAQSSGPFAPFAYAPYTSGSGAKGDQRVRISDFNGDGLADIAYLGPTGVGVQIYLSHGRYGFDAAIPGPSFGYNSGYEDIAAADFNGDGRMDISYVLPGESPRVYLSTGKNNLGQPLGFQYTIQGPSVDSNACTWVGDFNGDGKSDIAVGSGSMVVHLATGEPPDLLTRIENGYGGIEEVTYKPSSQIAANSPGLPIYQLVQSHRISGGHTTEGQVAETTYAFSGGVYDRHEKRFLGFEQVTAFLPQLSGEAYPPKVISHFLVDDRTTPIPKQIETYDENGKLRRLVKNVVDLSPWYPEVWQATISWSLDVDADHATLPAAATDPDKARIADMKAWWSQGTVDPKARRTLKSYVFDNSDPNSAPVNGAAFGNLVRTIDYGDFDQTGDETTQETIYNLNRANWIVRLPAISRLYKGTDTGGDKLGETQFYYDGATATNTPPARGELTKTLKLLSDAPIPGSGSGQEDPGDPQPLIYCAITSCVDGQVKCVKPSAGHTACRYSFASAPAAYQKCQTIRFQGRDYDTDGLNNLACGGGGSPSSVVVSDPLGGARIAVQEDVAIDTTTTAAVPSLWDRFLNAINPFPIVSPDAVQGAPTPRYVATETGYNANGNVSYTKDALGAQTTYGYESTFDLYVNLTTPPISTLATHVLEFDSICGLPTKVQDPNGILSVHTYDSFCRQTRTEIHYSNDTPTGAYTQTNYCGTGSMPACGDPTLQYTETRSPGPAGAGELWSRKYFDGFLRAYKTVTKGLTEAQNSVAETLFDLRRNAKYTAHPYFESDGAQTWETATHDVFGRVVRVVHPDNASVSTEYSARSVLTTDENGHQKQDLSEALAAGGVKITHKHTWNGSLQTTDSEEHDLYGNLAAVVDANGTRETYQYDTLGRKRFTNSPHVGNWESFYDDAGRQAEKHDAIRDGTYPNGQITKWQYDAMGRLRFKSSRFGTVQAVTYRYDYDQARTGFFNIGKRTSVAGPLGQDAYNYDLFGNLVGSTRVVDQVAYTMQSGYDVTGRLLWTRYPDGETVGSSQQPLAYDSAGRLFSIPGIVTSAQYDVVGRNTQLVYSDRYATTITRQYSPTRDWLYWISSANSIGTINQYLMYMYRPDARVQYVLSNLPTQKWHLVYDDLSQVTQAQNLGNSAYTQSFTYGINGNMLTNSNFPGYAYAYDSTQPHAVDSIGGLSFLYDANGNLKNKGGMTLDYDGEGRPTRIGSDTLTYDADGVRIKKVSLGKKTIYLGDDVEIADCGVTKYISFNGIPVARKANGETQWLHADRLGSILAVTNFSGALVGGTTRLYRPYGEEVTLPPYGVSLGFTGQRQDPSGLIYLHARYYDPQIGRFISPDPLVSTDWPTGINAYQYSDNDPFNKTDVTGMSGEGPTKPRRDVSGKSAEQTQAELNEAIKRKLEEFQTRSATKPLAEPLSATAATYPALLSFTNVGDDGPNAETQAAYPYGFGLLPSKPYHALSSTQAVSGVPSLDWVDNADITHLDVTAGQPGTPASGTLQLPADGRTRYVCLVACDDAGNWGAPGNVVPFNQPTASVPSSQGGRTGFSVYPNPVRDGQLHSSGNGHLYGLNGGQVGVVREGLNNVGNLPSGMYFVKSENNVVQKLVIVR
ncbi:MAG: FG-GAP-like repeat-containing protein [Pseudomonadota bacterium]